MTNSLDSMTNLENGGFVHNISGMLPVYDLHSLSELGPWLVEFETQVSLRFSSKLGSFLSART